MAQQALATATTRELTPTIRVGALREEIKQMCESVAQRAFQIFQSNGEVLGHDVEHWLQAERELFHPVHLDLSESAKAFTIRAEVPGFTANELEVNIDGQRVTISGRREKREEHKENKSVYSEYCSSQLLRAVDLPETVNAGAVTATLKDGILELEIPKTATPAKKAAIEAKNA